MRCSVRPASSAPSGSRSSSTSQRCCHINRCREVRRVAILTNAGGPGSWPPMRAKPTGWSFRRSARPHAPSCVRFCQRRRPSPIPWTCSPPLPPITIDALSRRFCATTKSTASSRSSYLRLVTEPADVACAIAEGARRTPGKPVLGVFMRAEGAPGTLSPIPSYAFPESAALALARVTAYGRWLAKPVDPPAVVDRVDRDQIRQVIEQVLARGGGWSTPEETTFLLAAAGIESAAGRTVTNVDAAVQAAAAIGYPVALKALGPTLLHKTERRAVCLNVGDAAGVRIAFADFFERLGGELGRRSCPAHAAAGRGDDCRRGSESSVWAARRVRNRGRTRRCPGGHRISPAPPERL